jgi:hypothetical protein
MVINDKTTSEKALFDDVMNDPKSYNKDTNWQIGEGFVQVVRDRRRTLQEMIRNRDRYLSPKRRAV